MQGNLVTEMSDILPRLPAHNVANGGLVNVKSRSDLSLQNAALLIQGTDSADSRNVQFRVEMPKPLGLPPLLVSIPNVFGLSTDTKVSRIAARWVVTGVHYNHSRCNGLASTQLQGHLMGATTAPTDINLAVTILISPSCPRPAFRWRTLLHFFPKTFGKRKALRFGRASSKWCSVAQAAPIVILAPAARMCWSFASIYRTGKLVRHLGTNLLGAMRPSDANTKAAIILPRLGY